MDRTSRRAMTTNNACAYMTLYCTYLACMLLFFLLVHRGVDGNAGNELRF